MKIGLKFHGWFRCLQVEDAPRKCLGHIHSTTQQNIPLSPLQWETSWKKIYYNIIGKCCTVGYGQLIFHQFWVTPLCSFDSLYLRWCEKVHLLASPEEGAKSLKETGSAKHFNKCHYTVLFLQMSVWWTYYLFVFLKCSNVISGGISAVQKVL